MTKGFRQITTRMEYSKNENKTNYAVRSKQHRHVLDVLDVFFFFLVVKTALSQKMSVVTRRKCDTTKKNGATCNLDHLQMWLE